MGYVDNGQGLPEMDAASMASHAGPTRSVSSLTVKTNRTADVVVTLTARKERFKLASGGEFDGYTLNGTSPGPTIRARKGQLIEVRLVNASVPGGVTLHWHGVDVPGAEDGVAGVTQDAVPIGGRYTYRFLAEQVGTFWYHSHQLSDVQVERGLLGALVISPAAADRAVIDAVALVHLYGSVRTINGLSGFLPVTAGPGRRVRVRIINTDNGPMPVWVVGASYRVVAVDGTEVNQPGEVTGEAVLVTAGGREDLEITMPSNGAGVRVEMGGSASVVLGSPSAVAVKAPAPAKMLDLLSYGKPAPLGFDPAAADRHFSYAMGRRPGFVRGVPGLWWTVNGHMFPNVAMFMVAEGDTVAIKISNHSGEVHPMHLHGHHAVVLSRNGVPASGSPWWVDSLNVDDGETYVIAFVADNPGIWMDHCHNLPHASQGLTAHLMYEGVSEPYRLGTETGNDPE
jgi:FtsP/CotA-like multicopper oxidase with cupredoxin domain